MPSGKKELCGTCQVGFSRGQSGAQCDVCQLWYHSTCENISEDELKAMENFKNLSFICTSCKNTPASAVNLLRDQITTLNNNFNEFIRKGEEDNAALKQTLKDIVADFKREVSTCISDLKSDVSDCNKLIKHVDSSTSSKIAQLETENNALHRKFNRSDLIIRGLPIGLTDLAAVVVELGTFYNVPINLHDINHTCYINKGTFVLAKFNSVTIRDEILKAYFGTLKTRSLLVSDLVKIDNHITNNQNMNSSANAESSDTVRSAQGDGSNGTRIDKRVFLNDHYTPAAGKINAICRKLLNNKSILKFKIFDGDKPKAKVTLLDGKDVVIDAVGCNALLKENL